MGYIRKPVTKPIENHKPTEPDDSLGSPAAYQRMCSCARAHCNETPLSALFDAFNIISSGKAILFTFLLAEANLGQCSVNVGICASALLVERWISNNVTAKWSEYGQHCLIVMQLGTDLHTQWAFDIQIQGFTIPTTPNGSLCCDIGTNIGVA